MAWLRRTIVSIGIGGASYAIMLALMLLSIMYDRTFEPIITLAFDTGRLVDQLVRLSRCGNLLGASRCQSSSRTS